LPPEFGARHVPSIARNEYGTPLVSDVFAQAERLALHDLLCYINTDIIVINDLLEVVSRVRRPRFLMLGTRWDLDITAPWDFDDPDWDTKLQLETRARGSRHSYVAADYHVFPRGQWGTLPPFAVGRTVYDTWLIWRARSLRMPVIDATPVVMSIHQNHDRTYTSLGMTAPEGIDDYQKGIEFRQNLLGPPAMLVRERRLTSLEATLQQALVPPWTHHDDSFTSCLAEGRGGGDPPHAVRRR
jgi:hypothetical protein